MFDLRTNKLPEAKTRWVAGLSNGETLVEGKGVVERIDGEDSPWHKLQKYLKERDLKITSFGIWVGDKHYNLPSTKPRFGGEAPLLYNCKRQAALNPGTGEFDGQHFVCAEAHFSEYILQLWVDENDTNKVWTSIINVKRD